MSWTRRATTMAMAALVALGLTGLTGGCAGAPGGGDGNGDGDGDGSPGQLELTVDTAGPRPVDTGAPMPVDTAAPLPPGEEPAGLAPDYPWYETWPSLAAKDALVVRGTVTSQRESADDADLPATVANVSVTHVAAGPASAGATIEVRHLSRAAGAPQLATGGEYVFVLVRYGETDQWQFPNPVQSIFPVTHGAATPLPENPLRPPADAAQALGLATG